ncbi:MAG: hypothetical protein ABSH35_34535, partial [Isosphaeraceae bacterium]
MRTPDSIQGWSGSKGNTVRRRNWRSEKLPSLNTWIRYLSQYGGERGLFLLRRTVLGVSLFSQGLNRYSQLLSAPVPDVPNPTSLKRLADRFNCPLR